MNALRGENSDGHPRGRWRTPIFGRAAFALWRADARRKADWMAPFMPPGGRLLDVGSGPGSLLRVLRDRGYDVHGLDIVDTAYNESLRPQLYNGGDFPFEADAFAAAIIATTLHHANDPVAVLSEARRCAPRIIVIEDVFRSPTQRRLTKAADSVTNLEFIGHPHNNRDDAGWRRVFDDLGLRLVHSSEKPYAKLFLQALYVLDRP